MRAGAGAGLLYIVIALNGMAHAQTSSDNDKCFKSTDYNVVIQGCTALLNSSTPLPADTRSSVLSQRARGYYSTDQFDLGHADADESIRLNPKNADGFFVRGLIWEAGQEYDLAVGDYYQAIRLDPSLSAAYYNRGGIYQSQGKLQRALTDFQHAAGLGDANATTQITDVQSALAKLPQVFKQDISNLVFAVPPDSNYADEKTDWKVPPQSTLQTSLGAKTPTTISGGKVITTHDLAALMMSKTKFVAIDAWQDVSHETLPWAKRLWFAGNSGTFDDEIQTLLGFLAQNYTDKDLTQPVVVACASSSCWESYNAALRLIKLGYTDVRWYRGGYSSWVAAKLPLWNDGEIENFLK